MIPTPERVKLEPGEMLIAATTGIVRNLISVLNPESRHRYEARPFDLNLTGAIEGAAGEVAVAKRFKLHWDASINNFGGPDVGPLKVRTRSRADYQLFIRPVELEKDDPRRVWLLVRSHNSPIYEIAGWIYGEEARAVPLVDHGNKNRPAHFVPDELLHSVEEFPWQIL